MSIDAIERRKIVAESFLLFKGSMVSAPLKNCYDFFSESLFGLKNIKNTLLGSNFFHALTLFHMGDEENNISTGISLIIQETNMNMDTNLYLFR